jgi:hypothetical protein
MPEPSSDPLSAFPSAAGNRPTAVATVAAADHRAERA